MFLQRDWIKHKNFHKNQKGIEVKHSDGTQTTKEKTNITEMKVKKIIIGGQVLNVSVDQLADLRGEMVECGMSSCQLLHFSQFTIIL